MCLLKEEVTLLADGKVRSAQSKKRIIFCMLFVLRDY